MYGVYIIKIIFVKGRKKIKIIVMEDLGLEEILEEIFFFVVYKNYCYYKDGSLRIYRNEF